MLLKKLNDIFWLIYYYIKPMPTIHKMVTQTEQGEVTVNINLTLNIKLDSNGNLNISSEVKPVGKISEKEFEYVIPDLDIDESDIIMNFGKEGKQ